MRKTNGYAERASGTFIAGFGNQERPSLSRRAVWNSPRVVMLSHDAEPFVDRIIALRTWGVGFRAVQSTHLFGRPGEFLGVLLKNQIAKGR